jgi:quercetin dioxygenase-like cupin family protein
LDEPATLVRAITGGIEMISISRNRRLAWRGLAVAGIVAATLSAVTGTVQAGQCPAGKLVVDGQGQKPGATKPVGVTDQVIGSIELAKEPIGLPDRKFRLRKLVIEPGGVVPWHSHSDRPAIIYIVEGSVVEYASTCAVPIVHKAGDTAPETHATAHWWKNTGKSKAVLLSADLLKDAADQHMM